MTAQQEADGETGRDLEGCIQAVEEAARDWGVHADALEGRFVSALLAAIAESGRMNRATVGEVERILAEAKAVGDFEVGRLKIVLAGGQKAIDIGKQAAELAIAATERARHEFDSSVARIADELSARLVDASQQWLAMRQRGRNRREASLIASFAVMGAFAILIGGLAGGFLWRGYQDGPALTAYSGMRERIMDCQREPVQVRDTRGGALRPACWLDQVVGRGG